MLELRQIVKNYEVDRKPLKVLKGINLSFPQHQFVSILGPSGCGKTTLLNLIGGLDHYTDGDLIIDGKSTKGFTDQDWDSYRNRRIGFVFQSYNLIPHLTVIENVELAMTLAGTSRHERRLKAVQVLKSVDLESETHKRPNQLSGGQMQRVAIARSLVNDPDIILADEPTGALDSKTSRPILELLKEISKTKLVIMVTHNQELAIDYSDRIISMKDGVIVDDTSSEEEIKEVPVSGKEINKHTSMSFGAALRSSFKNILTKKTRTIMTAVAGSFGIIGVALVLAVSNGFQNYIGRVEAGTLASYPVSVFADTYTPVTTYPTAVSTPFPSEEEVLVYDDSSPSSNQFLNYTRNIITEEFVEHVNELKDNGLAASIIYNYPTSLRLVGEYPNGLVNRAGSTSLGGFSAVPGGNFHELIGDENFVKQTYDLIGSKSEYPTETTDIVLIVDKYNRINKSTLERLALIDATNATTTKFNFDDIIGKKYKAFNNDEWFREVVSGSFNVTDFYGNSKTIKTYRGPYQNEAQDMFNDDNIGIELRISGILRVREDAIYNLMSSGLGYLPGLKEQIVAANRVSEISDAHANNFIIKKDITELNVGGGFDVTDPTTLAAFSEYFTFYNPYYDSANPQKTMTFTDYLSEAQSLACDFSTNYFLRLLDPEGKLPLYSLIHSIAIFPSNTSAKKLIIEHIQNYNDRKQIEWEDAGNSGSSIYKITYSDLVATITDTIGTMIDVISIVLIVFASISLVVSSVMIGVITYTSVLERTKEIGVLRALGARKKDVSRLFEAETFILGFTAGLIGDLVTILLSIPINIILTKMFPEQGLGNIAALRVDHALALIVISVTLTLVSGLVPSKIAANKDPVVALRTE